MPVRIVPLVNGEYYHIFNRGVAYLPTYSRKKDYERFITCLEYYRHNNLPCKLSRFLQSPKESQTEIQSTLEKEHDQRVAIISFSLMPNHFHLLIKQNTENGISSFMTHLINSYTRYFNTKYKRVGPIYQGVFKAVHIETDEQLLHLSRYIHLNPLVSRIVTKKDFLKFPWSSLQDFLNNNSGFIDTEPVLSHFSSKKDYLQFVLDQVDYGKELEKIKHLILEK